MEKTKVIFYNSTLLKGGTDTYMLEVIRNIDKEKFHIDVIIKDGDNVDDYMLKTLTDLGSAVYLAKGSFAKRMLFMRKFFKEHKGEYKVAHINATSGATGIIAYFAKKNGKIDNIIFHSHMGGNDNGTSIVDKIGTKLIFKNATTLASCSKTASAFMFGDKADNAIVLNNSVDTNKFKYNSKIRDEVRDKLNISKKDFVILHIGRFAAQKNHKRLIEIFAEVLKLEKSAKLVLIGDGVLFEETRELASSLGVSQNILFMGLQNNVFEFMSAADCFVMPSIHEGLPIVAVESQANGLPLVLSSNISTETKLAESVEFVNLDESNDVWAETILKTKLIKRKSGEEALKKHNFDKESAIKVIEKLYTK